MSAITPNQFVCPECNQSIAVNDTMKRTLLDAGCVVCGASIQPADINDTADSVPD
ncbi:DUF7560 family zinc ribbon protein [Halalkalirubrum salinum]|uniref:DUF7560 family zinc ribbon protein n=1 Tax=Halalkalirubrum salinum TaxID=2563889 RepID=UPI001484E392|nr:hypothetical protein [Halalkalirubrum salinum]